MDKEVINISLIALGESGVGKTSLSARFAKNTFSDSYLATIGIDFYVKEYVLPSYTLKVSLWDTAGQEQLRAVTSNTIKRANGVAICYDVTEQNSFEQMSYWIQNVKEKTLKVPIIIIGNKIDCENLLFENEQQLAEDFAKKNNFQYFRCSAKSGENVEHAFLALIKLVIEDKGYESEELCKWLKKEKNICVGKGMKSKKGKDGNSKKQDKKIKLEKESPSDKKKKKCCK